MGKRHNRETLNYDLLQDNTVFKAERILVIARSMANTRFTPAFPQYITKGKNMSVNQVSSNYKFETVGREFSDQTKKKNDALGEDAFLIMMVAQIQNQDPLNPLDGTDFTAQLAQFSSLEQQLNMNGSLEAILKSLDGNFQDNFLDYIGKNITSEDNTISIEDGKVSSGSYTIEESADIMIVVYDSDGQEISRLYPGNHDAGTYSINWNGHDSTGEMVQDGRYTYEVMATGSRGEYIPVKTTISGIVTGVTYKYGIPYLEVEGGLIDPASVVEVQLLEDNG